ncbi:uncharacterized protein LOC134005579 [Scomber scombrus]|uniref:uncharacterized protein LOC134005579 n=1 Tax=Scomber scombrus TaxID=13677 RepID=UPI002DDA2C4B|nr:uncharacterized protein LOC134005579 [Scomber scombrus]
MTVKPPYRETLMVYKKGGVSWISVSASEFHTVEVRLGWISVSVSESHIVKVQPGEDVTLQCKNTSQFASGAFWSKIVSKTKIVCISAMTGSTRSKIELRYCDGFQSGKFEMSTNISTVSLKIKQVNSSDSGLYYCGIYSKGLPGFSELCLNIEGPTDASPGSTVLIPLNNEPTPCPTEERGSDESYDDVDKTSNKSGVILMLTSVILGGLTAVLVMVIIGLLLKKNTIHNEVR